MDEKTTEDHSRWCPRCSSWAPESELRVPADGKPRHKACGTITLHRNRVDAAGNELREQTPFERLTDGPRPGGMVPLIGDAKKILNPELPAEMRELADRMATDEAGEGNFGAAAALKAFAAGPVVGTALEPIPATGEGLVMLGGRLEALTTTASWRAALERDIDEVKEVEGSSFLASDTLARALVAFGWVPGARRRAAELPKATAEQAPEPLRSRLTELADPDRYEEQPIEDADGAVIGHVWELQSRYCLEHEREWVAAVDGDSSNRPRFGSRDGAEGWVRANALRDGRPLTVPYDAEKVLGLKSEVVGWVWLDPEHAGEDGRWLAVHGAAPEHQHPNWGSPDPGPDARNQAIGWVLEQDKAARRG